MRSLIRQRGRVDAVSGRQDTHLGQMGMSAVFRMTRSSYEPSILGTVPATGTPIHLVTDEMLDTLLHPYKNQLYYLGRVYGSGPRLPLWFRHFDRGSNGAGEAYHLGIFGKTGSGKSVLAKKILLAYAKYPSMALLVIDPQGEFARDIESGHSAGGFSLPLRSLLDQAGRSVEVLTVKNLVLDRWSLFQQILYESLFFEHLTMPKGDNRDTACRILADRLQKKKIKLSTLHARSSFDEAWRVLAMENVQTIFYRTPMSRNRFDNAMRDADEEEVFTKYWSPVAQLFRTDRSGARSVDQTLKRLLTDRRSRRPMLVISLAKEDAHGLFWNDKIQSLVIKRVLDGLVFVAEQNYQDGNSLNTLVVIDEAHRLAPRELDREDDTGRSVRRRLVDATRTTRKYGLGWMFISQTLSSLDTQIRQQLRILFFGFGLGLGQEFQAVRELVGSSGTTLQLYQGFRDPHSAINEASRQYSFMTVGPVSPLSFSGSPLFFNAYNNIDDFLSANGFAKP